MHPTVLPRWTLARSILLAVILGGPSPASADSQTADKAPDNRGERITLQYRIQWDAVAPSGFVAVYDTGMTFRLEITWSIPTAEKERLDRFIEELERQQVNGVEFECRGEWIVKGFALRVTSPPQLSETGKRRIREAERYRSPPTVGTEGGTSH